MIECAIAAVTPVLPSGRRKRMVNLEALWRKAAALLQQAGIEDAAFDARGFAACAVGQTPVRPAGPGERGGPAASGAALCKTRTARAAAVSAGRVGFP